MLVVASTQWFSISNVGHHMITTTSHHVVLTTSKDKSNLLRSSHKEIDVISESHVRRTAWQSCGSCLQGSAGSMDPHAGKQCSLQAEGCSRLGLGLAML